MRLIIHVKPKSRETQLFSEPDGTLIMHVAASPEKGKANREIVKFMAKRLGRSSEVSIITGSRSSRKVIEVLGIDVSELSKVIEIPKTGDLDSNTQSKAH